MDDGGRGADLDSAPDGGAGSKRGVEGVDEAPKPFQQQAGRVTHYESPTSKIHNSKYGSRRPTPDKAPPKNTRPGR